MIVNKKVVIVDDTMFMRLTLKNILQGFGLEIAGEGSNGHEAVTLYKRIKPDLITMDITMPQKDGLEAVKEIMAHDQEAVIIMVSAMGQKAKVVEAISAGAKDFIVKPFKQERIAGALERVGIAIDADKSAGKDAAQEEETEEVKDDAKEKAKDDEVEETEDVPGSREGVTGNDEQNKK